MNLKVPAKQVEKILLAYATSKGFDIRSESVIVKTDENGDGYIIYGLEDEPESGQVEDYAYTGS